MTEDIKKKRSCKHNWGFIEKGRYPASPETDEKDECQECGKIRKHKHEFHKCCDICGYGYD